LNQVLRKAGIRPATVHEGDPDWPKRPAALNVQGMIATFNEP